MNLEQSKNIAFRMLATSLLLTGPQALSAQVMQTFGKLFDFEHVTVYVLAAFLIGFFVLLFYNFVYHYREQDAKTQGLSQYARLSLVLQTSSLRLCFYNVRRRHYIFLNENGEYSKEYNPVEFAELFDRDDFEQLRKLVFDICEERIRTASVRVRGVLKEDDTRDVFDISVSVARRRNRMEIEDLLCIMHDVTDDVRRRETVKRLLLRYHTVFNSPLLDMVFYDKYGVLNDLNERACSEFGYKNREELLNGDFLLQDNPFYSGEDFHQLENTRSSSRTNFAKLRNPTSRVNRYALPGVQYYESTFNPIRNENGELEGVYMAGRNVTEMVESFHRQQEGFKKLRQITKDIKTYIDNVNYALQVSDVRLANYNPSTHTMEVSSNINETQMHLSQLRCIRLGTPRFRRAISSALNRMDHRTELPLEVLFETEIRDKQHRPVWLLFNMVPMKDEQGRVERYFGMCRNMTQMVETEHQLAIETKKAQETELLKQAFLTNMSYEIRTPLNTVVGFAELFESEHDVADEPLFVEEIRRNSNSLLSLVNDILFLSRLDANMIEYKKEETDFAMLFESWCQLGLVNVSPEVRVQVENPFERLLVNIDTEHVGKVIQRVCSTAVNFTQKGSIHVKAEYRKGHLSVVVEDTGRGIDKETLPHVFERFVRDQREELCGTGLDLPIAQTLVEQMGGSIELQSEVGKGTTVWVVIPCEASVIERRRELIE